MAIPSRPFTFAVPATAVTLHADTLGRAGPARHRQLGRRAGGRAVPRSRTFHVDGPPAGRTTVAGVSFPAFAQATMAAVSVGATRRALRLFRELAAHKAPSFPRPDGPAVGLARDPVVADRMARAEAGARAAAGYLRRATEAAAAGDEADLALAAPHAAATGAAVARALWDLSGMTVLAEGDPLGRALLDVQAAGQNAVVAPARFAEAGAALLGAPPP